MRAIPCLLLLSGCFLSLERQQAADYVASQTARASQSIVMAATSAGQLADAAVRAVQAEDATVVAQAQAQMVGAAENLAGSLQSAHAAIDEAGRMIVVIQEDVGSPQSADRITTPAEAETLRAIYRAKASIIRTIMPAITKLLPSQLPTGAPYLAPAGWSSTNIGALAASVLSAMTALGVGLQKAKAAKDAAAARRDAEAAQAEQARLQKALTQGEGAIEELKGRVEKPVFAAVMAQAPAMVAQHRMNKATEAIAEAERS
jgi:hypothetical protein